MSKPQVNSRAMQMPPEIFSKNNKLYSHLGVRGVI